jgi:general secretion pathway protein I
MITPYPGRRPRNSSRLLKSNRGFTLLEVLIAMMILASGIILLSSSWGGSTFRLKKTQINIEMTALLERKITELDFKYRGKPLDGIPEEEEDDFDGLPDYSWKMSSKNFEIPDLTAFLIGQEGGANQMMLTIMKQFTEHLNKSIKEVTVTVVYKGAKKPMESRVIFFLVDYNKELPLEALGALGSLPGGNDGGAATNGGGG